MKFNPFKITDKIPHEGVRNRVLDSLLAVGIPFNIGVGLQIKEINPCRVEVKSPPRFFRRNHVGGAHACALALMGEYAAGLLVAQKFPLSDYRMIIGKLEIDYHKQGRGSLKAYSEAPLEWPEISEEGSWIPMVTKIENSDGELVAECKTNWQVKAWSNVRKK